MALVIQLVDRMCNDCFKLKHLFLLSLDLVDILVKNVDELGSEHHVRTHINEPPCYNLKTNQKSFEKYIYKSQHFMKSRGNSSNKVEKQMFEAKIVIKINLKLTGNRLWPVFTETEQQINRKTIIKAKLKNPNFF